MADKGKSPVKKDEDKSEKLILKVFDAAKIKKSITSYEDEIKKLKKDQDQDDDYNEANLKKLKPIRDKIVAQKDKVLSLPDFNNTRGFVDILKETRALLNDVESQVKVLPDIKSLYLKEVRSMIKTMEPMRLCFMNYLYTNAQLSDNEKDAYKNQIETFEMTVAKLADNSDMEQMLSNEQDPNRKKQIRAEFMKRKSKDLADAENRMAQVINVLSGKAKQS